MNLGNLHFDFCIFPGPWSLTPGTFFTTVVRALQIQPFLQNKPNFRKVKMKLNFYSTKDYENEPRLRTPGIQTQLVPA
jgi:hypothetical protein